MSKFKPMLFIGVLAGMIFILGCPVFADLGDFCFFGGISAGRKLPKTTELILDKKDGKKKKDDFETPYKEIMFLSGVPTTYEGKLTVKGDMDIDINDKSKLADSYDVTYTTSGTDLTDEGNRVEREIKYKVNYRIEGDQVIKDYEIDKPGDWDETIIIGGTTYNLTDLESDSSVSVIEHHTPGVTYYKGDISHRAVYSVDESKIVWEISGTFYGYDSAWSSTETHRIDGTVTTDKWQMQYQIRPSVSVGKTLQYSENEPTAISFSGNYREVMQNKSGLSYNIYAMPKGNTYKVPTTGTESISSFNTFEQLIAPNLGFLKGHFAEADIKKLFAMQILDGEPTYYQPSQSITRGQFVTMLVKAAKLPVEEETAKKKSSKKKKEVINVVFPDVTQDREDYRYIMAAYNSGLAVGRDNGHFYTDAPIERQEAIVILLRILGLENLGLDPTPVTSFADDRYVADWAKKEVYAAARLGIIAGDSDGNFRPKSYVSKAEAAAFVNRLVNYMRDDLLTDYTEHIVNYAN